MRLGGRRGHTRRQQGKQSDQARRDDTGCGAHDESLIADLGRSEHCALVA
jgi:hypothetical protein